MSEIIYLSSDDDSEGKKLKNHKYENCIKVKLKNHIMNKQQLNIEKIKEIKKESSKDNILKKEQQYIGNKSNRRQNNEKNDVEIYSNYILKYDKIMKNNYNSLSRTRNQLNKVKKKLLNIKMKNDELRKNK